MEQLLILRTSDDSESCGFEVEFTYNYLRYQRYLGLWDGLKYG